MEKVQAWKSTDLIDKSCYKALAALELFPLPPLQLECWVMVYAAPFSALLALEACMLN